MTYEVWSRGKTTGISIDVVNGDQWNPHALDFIYNHCFVCVCFLNTGSSRNKIYTIIRQIFKPSVGIKPNVDRRFFKVNPTLMKRREPNRWYVKYNPTLARKREPDRRYVISSPTAAEERKLDRRFAYSHPTLVKHRQTDADLQATISTFHRRWFEVTLQNNIIFWNNSHHYVKYQLNPCQTIITRCIPNDLHLLQTDMVTSTHLGCFRLHHEYYMSSSQKKPPIFTSL
jgi:hypothetical protein